jgi:hypothetical protein
MKQAHDVLPSVEKRNATNPKSIKKAETPLRARRDWSAETARRTARSL